MQDELVIEGLLKKRKIELAKKYLGEHGISTAELVMARELLKVYDEEIEAGCKHTILENFSSLSQWKEQYIQLKLLLRRLEYDLPDTEDFFACICRRQYSVYFIGHLVKTNLFHPKKVSMRLVQEFEKQNGRDCSEAVYFRKMEEELGEDKL